ncbi:MAG: DUF4169 family protein [Brevundimonas sp.]|jgi:hypothetical protein|uniref:DUF4169 family protein n=1 Tax=Brevundimonas sp. TaxID=1871086 RepID=UPI0022BBE636|nr:DUF4169 family protein [Brevundimonas sp.]MCZ8087112.1 DUF4169 family protein [Brevundimonas sp.]MCZ8193112.1 DUF4169 family protein [Brevundimonas sp.]
MAEIINLNRARKVKARAADKASAAANRLAFGRTKTERDQATHAAELERRRLDGAKRDADDPEAD